MIVGLFAAWNSHDPDKVAACFGEDAIYEDTAAGQTHRGRAEIRKWAADAFRDIENFKITMESVSVHKGRGMAEWIWSGTDKGLMKTGKGFTVRGVSVFEVNKGKIRRYREYYDFSTVLRQLGVLPADGATVNGPSPPPAKVATSYAGHAFPAHARSERLTKTCL